MIRNILTQRSSQTLMANYDLRVVLAYSDTINMVNQSNRLLVDITEAEPVFTVSFSRKELKRLHKEVVRQRESVNGVRSYQYFGIVLN